MRSSWHNASMSQRQAAVRWARRCALALALTGLAGLLPQGLARAGGPNDAQWLDVEGRIEYAYYTEDQRALANMIDMVGAQSESALRPYYVALASYHLAQLRSAPGGRGEPRKPAEGCVDRAGEASRADEQSPEAPALQSACLALLARLSSLPSPLLHERSGAQMRRAVGLAPRNPRVLLLQAQTDLDLSAGKPASPATLATLQRAIAAFELERQSLAHAPDWGAAEAYAALGRSYLDRGDAIAARGALEHALLLVPDFAYAHRLMARITAG
jgi:tetratricopeptide (TPR) repeat protein